MVLVSPTADEMKSEYDRQVTIYNSFEYERDRSSAYPSIQDQLDMMYHDQVNGTITWKDTIAGIKSSNPKS